MAYKNKTYVAFHYGKKGITGDGDKSYYYTLEMWRRNDKIDFSFYDAHEITNIMEKSGEQTIKSSLQERLRNTKIMILLMGEKSKNRPWVKWELEQAISRDIPLIVVDVTRKSNEINHDLLPKCLIDYKFAYTYFEKDRIVEAMDKWFERHSKVDLGKHEKY